MLRLIAISCLLASAAIATATPPSVREDTGKLIFANELLELQFDRATGAWVGLSEKSGGGNLIGHCPLRTPVDFQSNGQNVCSANAPVPTNAEVRDLAGQWLFGTDPEAVGEKEGWRNGLEATPAPRTLAVPGYWEQQGVTEVFPNSLDPTWTPYNGDAWYQREVDIPAEWTGSDLQFSAGSMDDFDWVYLNGELIGHTGEDTPNWWAARRLYAIPAKLVKFGARNRLVAHIFDRGGDGGIVGPVMIGRIGKLPETSRWAPCGLKYVNHSLAGNTLTLVTRAGDWQVTMTYELIPGKAVVRRALKLKWEGQGPTRIGTTQWIVPGVRLGDAVDCEIRGPQWDQPVTRFAPCSGEKGEAAPPVFSSPGTMHEDSVWGSGAWSAVYNRKLKRAVVVSFIARTEGFLGWAREGENEASLGSNLNTADLTKPGQEYDLGAQYVSVRRGEWSDCLTAVRDMYKLHGFVARPTAPEWARRAIIYTMYPGGTMESGLRDTGGFDNVTQYTLPRIKDMGCNTLWFLPICPGLYGPKDYYAIEPAIGTEADLHSCVAAAKTQGINVLLDLVPHGPDTSSPIGREHPEWVGKDEKGQPALWWGCTYCDYANLGWQKYMADVARYFVEKHGVKGWRVDCAPGGPANWDPNRQVRASMSSMYGGLEVLKAAKESMRQVDRDVVLLPEGTGPMLLENADIVYDYTMYFTIFKHFMDAESPDIWVKRTSLWLEQQRLSWPEGGCFGLMRLLENHDNVRYWRYAGVGPARALMAMCAWIQGVPLYNHLQEVGSSEEFTRINTLRKQVEELNTGTARYFAAKADKPGVFTCLREDGDKKALVVINLTGQTMQTTLALPDDALPQGTKLVAYDAWGGHYVNPGGKAGSPRATLRQVKLNLPAYGPALVLLRPAGAALPVEDESVALVAPISRLVTSSVSESTLQAGDLTIQVANTQGGLPSSLTVGGANLLYSADLAEGHPKPLGPGKGLSVKSLGQATVTSSKTPAPTVTAEGSVLRGTFGGKDMRLPYKLTYQAVTPDDVLATIAFQAPQTLKRTTGTLSLELAFQGVDRWAVNTIEGQLEDSVTRFHPVPGDYLSGWLQHPTGDRLWENATLPLDPQNPRLGVRSADNKRWLSLSAFQASPDLPIDNLYLRETRGPDRKEVGPTLVIAWMDNKCPRDLVAGHWYELSFRLSNAYPGPLRSTNAGPVTLRADGGNYVLENSHYRLTVGKSGGGVIRSFVSRQTGWRAITGTDTYTDNGFYEKANNEGGQFGSAADWPDLDPEVSLRRAGDRAILEITGKLHGSNWNWAFAASPAIEYRKTFICDGSGTVHCEIALKPFARSQMKGFLAHRMMLPAMSQWIATGQDKVFSGQPGGPNTRTWQSKASSFRDQDAALAFTGLGGENLLLSHLNMTPRPQNVFIHQNGREPNLFLAWYDFDPVDVPATWHTLTYDLTIVPGGVAAARKLVGR